MTRFRFRNALAVAAALAAAVAARPTLAQTAPAQSVPPINGFVHAPGGPFLVDDQGRRLQLHGVNLVAKCGSDTAPAPVTGSPCIPGPQTSEPAYYLAVDPSEPDPERRITDTEAATLSAEGVDVVRLGIIWAALEPGPPGVTPNDPRYCSPHIPGTPFTPPAAADEPFDQATVDAYLSHVDAVVALLAKHGIRSLVDMHQDVYSAAFYNPSSSTPWKGEGSPLWATCESPFSTSRAGTPSSAPTWPEGYATDFRVGAAALHFWANDVSADLQGEFIRTWQAVAAHYRDDPAVIGYDLYNEPFDGTTLTGPEFDRKLQCFYSGQRYAPLSCAAAGQAGTPAVGLIPAIQQVDPNHLEFFEPPITDDYIPDDTVAVPEPMPFPNLVLGFHDYTLTGVFTSGSCTAVCVADERTTIAEESTARAHMRTAQPGGPAWFMSEFGGGNDVGDTALGASLADSALLGWTYWAGKQLHDPTGGQGEALLGPYGTPDAAKQAVLARTYPLAVAGTPVSQSFDPATGAFHLAYTPDPRVDAPTEVFVPVAQHYPGGYAVAVSGAVVTSGCDASLLLLRTLPGATGVDLRVAPGPCTAGAGSGHVASASVGSSAGPAGVTGLPDTHASSGDGPVAALVGVPLAALAVRRRVVRPRRPRGAR